MHIQRPDERGASPPRDGRRARQPGRPPQRHEDDAAGDDDGGGAEQPGEVQREEGDPGALLPEEGAGTQLN